MLPMTNGHENVLPFSCITIFLLNYSVVVVVLLYCWCFSVLLYSVCCCFFSGQEKEGQNSNEAHPRAHGHGVRLPQRPGIGLRHDRGGALLPVHPRPLQPPGHPRS